MSGGFQDAYPINVSRVTAIFLNTVWGCDRFARLIDARAELNKSLYRFHESGIRLARVDEIVEQELQIEDARRQFELATLRHDTAKMTLETTTLTTEGDVRRQQCATEVARLKAEQREHDQKAQPPERKEPQPRRDSAEDEMHQAFARTRRHWAVIRELNKMRQEVDKSVAAREFTKEEGEKIKEEMEDIIYASLKKRADGGSKP
jgi:hypothetical protein